MNNVVSRTIRILMIEDNDGDVFLAKKAFSTLDTPHEIHVYLDSELALDYLRACESDRDTMRPDIIFLDLNLPKVDGRQILAEIKGNKLLATIPVIALSSSRSEQDVRSVYALHANAYLVKPQSLDEFRLLARRVDEFWFRTALLAN